MRNMRSCSDLWVLLPSFFLMGISPYNFIWSFKVKQRLNNKNMGCLPHSVLFNFILAQRSMSASTHTSFLKNDSPALLSIVLGVHAYLSSHLSYPLLFIFFFLWSVSYFWTCEGGFSFILSITCSCLTSILSSSTSKVNTPLLTSIISPISWSSNFLLLDMTLVNDTLVWIFFNISADLLDWALISAYIIFCRKGIIGM